MTTFFTSKAAEKEQKTPPNQKRVALMLRLNTLVFFGTITYALLDKFIGVHVEWYVYLVFIVFAIINYWLIKKSYIETSKIIALSVFNGMIFLVTTSEPYETGMHLQFVSVGAVALALYGYEKWKGAIAFILLTLGLEIIAFKTDIILIPWRDVDADQAQVFFLLNLVIAAGVSVYTILLISKFDYDSEKALKLNEKFITQQNNQLIKINDELDRFVYSASHDLRAPLSTLEGLINLIELSGNEKDKNEYIRLMKLRIHSMNDFIDEIVNYSRNSRLEIERKPIRIKKLVEAVYNEHRFMPKWDKIEVKWNMDEEIIIQSDEMRVKMVLANLISNAIRYSDPNKERSWIKLSGEIIDEKAIIEVADNGLGISETYHQKIFDMFFRARDDSAGSGLGLYIAKETINKLSGDIFVDSKEGEGAIFKVVLPVS